ncbi:hypothetical protein CapIbe_013564 [Capra ibex]
MYEAVVGPGEGAVGGRGGWRSSQQQGRPRVGGEKAKVTSGEGAAKAGVLSQYGRQASESSLQDEPELRG